MALKKKNFKPGEIVIYDEAVIYKRGDYWQFRMWLGTEDRYAIKSLKTRSESTAIEKGREAYHEIYSNMRNGKKYFSITTKEGAELYTKHRQIDVDNEAIVKGRLTTIKAHLNHWLDFIGRDTKLKELEHTDCENYLGFRKKEDASQSTIINEQATINACMKFLFREKETSIDAFTFRDAPKEDKNADAVRRATFTKDEYNRVCVAARSYCAKKKLKLDEAEYLTREIVRHWILIGANSGMRIGEMRQLKWREVEILNKKRGDIEHALASIFVRAETSKWRKSRKLICRGGYYFERLKEILKPEGSDSLVLSIDGEKQLPEKILLKHFYAILEMARIEDSDSRNIVPYSLRHYMITDRIMAGVPHAMVAEMVGNSAREIENTYYHLNDSMRMTSAMAYYKITEDGTISQLKA